MLDLVESIVKDKFWRRGPWVFCVALTRARYREGGVRFCRCTGVGRVFVGDELAPLVRRGVVLVVRRGSNVARLVFPWDVFVYAVRRGVEDVVAEELLNEAGARLVTKRLVKRVMGRSSSPRHH